MLRIFRGAAGVGDQASHVALGRSVIIVGAGSLQNKLLANLIEQRTGYACSTRPADQVKGIEAIFRGEYWLPRRLLGAHLERTRTVQLPASPAATLLTRKELETLRLLATGSSTEHIANELRVSPHTVKTHIYNLFRKIRVSNRVQAVHWASQNMVIPGVRVPR